MEDTFKQGEMVQVIYLMPPQRNRRVMYARWLGPRTAPGSRNVIDFDLRPIAGTTELEEAWIHSIEPSAKKKPQLPEPL